MKQKLIEDWVEIIFPAFFIWIQGSIYFNARTSFSL